MLRSLLIILLMAVLMPLVAENTLHFVPSGNSDYASFYSTNTGFDTRALATVLDERIYQLQSGLGIYTETKVSIFVVNNQDEYLLLSRGKNSIVEFSDAFYSSQEQRIYIRPKQEIKESYLQVLLHEYVHWYLDQIFDYCPLWFHEGMATYYAKQLGYDRYIAFIKSSFWGKKTDLFRLSNHYPQDQKDWQNYYLSSYFAIRWMKEKNPKEWQSFWDRTAQNWRRGYPTSFIPTFRMAYRINLWEFNNIFHPYLKSLSRQYLIVGVNSLIIALLPFILLIAANKRRKKLLRLPDFPLPDAEEGIEMEFETQEDEKETVSVHDSNADEDSSK